jgi:hypothetical protein
MKLERNNLDPASEEPAPGQPYRLGNEKEQRGSQVGSSDMFQRVPYRKALGMGWKNRKQPTGAVRPMLLGHPDATCEERSTPQGHRRKDRSEWDCA